MVEVWVFDEPLIDEKILFSAGLFCELRFSDKAFDVNN